MAVTPHVVERVRTASGKLLYQRKDDNLGRIIEPRYAGMMNAMMQETLLTGTARKAELPGWPAAGKTGTSQDFRDAWFIGYTGHLVTGVWLGNDDASPTKKTTGGGLPVEIWSKFMKAAHQGVPVVGLPGVSSAPLTAGLSRRSAVRGWRRPRRCPSSEGPVQAASADGGIDNWLINRLFGRR